MTDKHGIMDNILLLTDGYKASHYLQYPPKTTKILSYFESRGGKFPEITFFGLQYFIKRYLIGKVVTKEKIKEAEEFFTSYFGDKAIFNKAGWEYILEKYNGCLPIRIMAVPEGMTIPIRNVLMTIENTDPNCFWLTNYLETLLVQVWYSSTVCTLSREIKKVIFNKLVKTGTPELVDFKLVDFGFRGVSSVESAGIGGLSHLVNFKSTDTLEAVIFAKQYYNESQAGFSIPAAEHSTITSWEKENEAEAYKNMLCSYKGLRAVVSDSYNIFNACENIWGKQLKEMVLNLDGILIVRPDSGEPVEIVPKVIEILGKQFGFIENSKGYRVLHPKIRVIQGDGVNYDSIKRILEVMDYYRLSADNIAFGMGGALLQGCNRDTQSFAFKCCYAQINDREVEVFKDPITDKGKGSKRGIPTLVYNTLIKDTEFETVCYSTYNSYKKAQNLLIPYFENGKLLVDFKLQDIRKLARN